MSKKKEFINIEDREVRMAESLLYAIQLGKDLFSNKGNVVFNEVNTNKFYNKLLRELRSDILGGSPKEKKIALRMLENLRVIPLKIH